MDGGSIGLQIRRTPKGGTTRRCLRPLKKAPSEPQGSMYVIHSYFGALNLQLGPTVGNWSPRGVGRFLLYLNQNVRCRPKKLPRSFGGILEACDTIAVFAECGTMTLVVIAARTVERPLRSKQKQNGGFSGMSGAGLCCMSLGHRVRRAHYPKSNLHHTAKKTNAISLRTINTLVPLRWLAVPQVFWSNFPAYMPELLVVAGGRVHCRAFFSKVLNEHPGPKVQSTDLITLWTAALAKGFVLCSLQP